VRLDLERDLISAEPAAALINPFDLFPENLVKAIGSCDWHGSPIG
jgi:hypothetical protein